MKVDGSTVWQTHSWILRLLLQTTIMASFYIARQVEAPARPASFYGEAVISPGYVKREWTKYLTFCDFVDDPAKFNQALIIMQKPVNAKLPSELTASDVALSPKFASKKK